MSIKVETTFAIHDGGTKFYETVLLTYAEGDCGILLKRWGAMGQKNGAGEHMTHEGTPAFVTAERNKIVKDKAKLRPGKGKYVASNSMNAFGLHALSGRNTSYGLETVVEYATKHYLSKPSYAEHLRDVFSLAATTHVPAPHTSNEFDPVAAYDDWGSF